MNFFQAPNFLWDREDLDVYERVILIHIIRKTIGWGKSEDGISLSQFKKALGISKSTVIRTLKKLIEKNIIVKKTSFSKNGAQSFNFYSLTDEIIQKANSSISQAQGVCLRETGGSISQAQGDVSERHTQNTSNTKNTNTTDNNKKTNKETSEKFSITSALEKSDINQLLNDLKVDESFVYELDNHRKSINKPIVNIKALIATLKEIREASIKTKRSANEILTIMQEQGWKSVKAEWINNLEGRKKGRKRKDKEFDRKELEKFGFKFDDEIIETNLIEGDIYG